MSKEVLSDKQGISVISLFIIGSSIILTIAGESKQDLWLAIIMSIIASIPLSMIYSRLLVHFPEKDLYDILPVVFGKIIGKGISILFILFSFILGGLVLRVFGDFISVTSLTQTPIIISMFLIGILCIWAVKAGIEIIGRLGEFFLTGTIILISIFTLFLVNRMSINNLSPTLSEGIKPIIEGSFHAFIFPFTQIAMFTAFFSTGKVKHIRKVFILGLLIGGIIIYISSITNILVLGSNIAKEMYFPTYASARRLSVRDVIENLEVVIAATLLIGGFIKVCICLLSTCNGVAKVFGLGDYKFIVTPIGLLIINLSYFIHESVMEKAEFASDIYPSYALPFQVILPIIIFITVKIKKNYRENSL